MPGIFDVTFHDIERLNDIQLTELLLCLLHIEAVSSKIPLSCVGVSLKIDVADGGEDGRIKWEGDPEHTDWIPNRFTIFQCKATDMPPATCHKEILKRNTTDLKPRIDEVLDAGGSYVLFYGRNCNAEQQALRIPEFRRAINEVGKPYSETADIRIYDANKIAEWVNLNVATIVKVSRWVGRPVYNGLQTWKMVRDYPENRHTYVIDENLTSYIDQIRSYLDGPRNVVRIVGLSGLGKTRLAIETFRLPEDELNNVVQTALSNRTVFIDGETCARDLPGYLIEWRSTGTMGILVVDNCDLELHQKLSHEIKHPDNLFSLLTLDYNPEPPGADYPIIKLNPVTNDLIKKIIQQSYPGLREPDINRIAEFAQGFPQIAVMFAKARLDWETNIFSLDDRILVDKLLWGRNTTNPEAKKVISCFALFETLGFNGEKSNELNFLADNICKMDRNDVYRIACEFIDRGILDKHGRYVRVTPLPMALHLAADWWKHCPPEQAKELLQKDMPEAMLEALYNQLSLLDFLPIAQELVNELCGPNAPFGEVEVLNSAKGSRLFHSLVTVNPQATVHALERVFSNLSREELLEVGPGRRNLIWALEKLCFREETFPVAAPLMLLFASAENETWGNNATNQFLQLFHILLSGTQAHPSLRLKVIDDALGLSVLECRKLAVKALGSAMKSRSFSRSGGVEKQGSRPPLQDWQPNSSLEIKEYWISSLERLTNIACNEADLADLARQQIANNIRGLVDSGFIDEVDVALRKIIEQNSALWPEALEQVQRTIKYAGKTITPEKIERLREWIILLQPKSMPDQLHLLVSIPPWEMEKDENGHYIDLGIAKALKYAEECVSDLELLQEHLTIISEGEQRKGFVFGYRIGECLAEPGNLIQAFIETLRHIPIDKANPSVLAGLLSAKRISNPELVQHVLKQMAEDILLCPHIVNIIRMDDPTENDLQLLISLVDSGRVPIYELGKLTYSKVFSNVEPNLAVSFCESIAKQSLEGVWVAFELLYIYSSDEVEKFNACHDILRNILLSPNLLKYEKLTDTNAHNWQELCQRLLRGETGDDQLALHIASEIVALCAEREFKYTLDLVLEPVVSTLLASYQELTWPVFSDGLLSDDGYTEYNMSLLFDSNREFGVKVLTELPSEILMRWCESNTQKAPEVLANIINPLSGDSESPWHPVTRFLFEHYSTQPHILSIIASRMGPSSWTGSIVPYYEKQIEPLKKLLDHRKPEVRKWASDLIEGLQLAIQKEKQRDAEHSIGIMRW